MTESNLLSLVKPWSTWVFTSKTSSQSLITLLIESTHTRGQRSSQTLVKPWCPWASSRTFAAFSKLHLNISKSPNIIEGHNFAFGCHFKFGVYNGENLGQLQSRTIHQRQENCKLACRLCKIHCSKPLWAFIEDVEGSLIYNYAYFLLVLFSSKFWRYSQSNSGK
jgi:hypothetical protein